MLQRNLLESAPALLLKVTRELMLWLIIIADMLKFSS